MLDPSIEKRVQSLVFTGFASLPSARIVRLRGIGSQWLAKVLPHIAFGRERREVALQLLLTPSGLKALGATEGQIRAIGSKEFELGMTSPQTRLRLGDVGDAASQWTWSDRRHEVSLIIYGPDPAATKSMLERMTSEVTIEGELEIRMPHNGREPFGFQDGISNIRLERPGTKVSDGVPDGDLLLGNEDSTGWTSEVGPLGLNGSLVVVRELQQDVQGFWRFWTECAEGDTQRAVFLASKAVGRWPNGMPIEPGQECEPELQRSALDVRSFAGDPKGVGCPFGSHVRRTNPRDTLVESPQVSFDVTALHRIMRRGRIYGPTAPNMWYPAPLRSVMGTNDEVPPDAERGLMFVGLCSDLRRQFEFIMHNWVNFPKHANLLDEVDPLFAQMHTSRVFTMQTKTFPCFVEGVGGWIRARGGAYYLLPSRAALELLADCESTADPA